MCWCFQQSTYRLVMRTHFSHWKRKVQIIFSRISICTLHISSCQPTSWWSLIGQQEEKGKENSGTMGQSLHVVIRPNAYLLMIVSKQWCGSVKKILIKMQFENCLQTKHYCAVTAPWYGTLTLWWWASIKWRGREEEGDHSIICALTVTNNFPKVWVPPGYETTIF